MNRFHESGQIGLIVLLISAVMMTIGLGVASQSVFESKSARQEVESTQTFNAAEQGLEEALSNLSNVDDRGVVQTFTLPDGTSGQYLNTEVRDFEPINIDAGKSLEIKLIAGSNFNVTWTVPSAQPCASAIIVTVIQDNPANAQLARNSYKHNLCTNGNGFTNADSCDADSCTVGVPATTFAGIARVKVVYATTTLTVDGTLPVQGIRSQSTATGPSGTITLDQTTLTALPSIFDYVLFSGNGNIPQ